ncbi:hypothetical protein SAMN05216311_108223 [Chitinophaga sp. CF418]|nr:hypothetical protein SAMN05216311_108223 [Chitinophaga sp. CF418]
MQYFGTEIFDGKIYADFPLDEDVLLEDQFLLLTSDVGGGILYQRLCLCDIFVLVWRYV